MTFKILFISILMLIPTQALAVAVQYSVYGLWPKSWVALILLSFVGVFWGMLLPSITRYLFEELE